MAGVQYGGEDSEVELGGEESGEGEGEQDPGGSLFFVVAG